MNPTRCITMITLLAILYLLLIGNISPTSPTLNSTLGYAPDDNMFEIGHLQQIKKRTFRRLCLIDRFKAPPPIRFSCLFQKENERMCFIFLRTLDIHISLPIIILLSKLTPKVEVHGGGPCLTRNV